VAIPREGREPVAPDTPPIPQVSAPTLIYDPGSAPGTSRSEGLATIVGAGGSPAGFFAGAVSTVLNAFSKSPDPWRGRQIVADSETGKLTAKGTIPQGRGVRTIVTAEQDSLAALQKTFDTGLVQSGIAPWYSDFANALASFRIELDQANEPGGFVNTQPPPGDRGETVPGFETPSLPSPGDGFGSDERGGPIGSSDLNKPVDLRNLFMPTNPYMPFSGLPSPRGGGGVVRRRRRAKKAKKTRARKASSTRKLKFGSPAYRRKYLGHK
jgi:hypothetical protein